MPDFGASFSIKYAREMGVDPHKCLQAALKDLRVRRLRLMSYWNEHEKVRGTYDFSELDWQLDLAKEFNAEVTLCLGLRQPRWPESHWPEWARGLPENEWIDALHTYIEVVVNRYKNNQFIVSYQLENEARLKKFGEDGNFDRRRLKSEFKLVKSLDPSRPVIMSTSDSWGLPFLGPKPDMYAFSVYRYFYDKGEYKHSSRPPLFYAYRAAMIRLLKWRRVFIHELQAEPWGPRATSEMTLAEQFTSMPIEHVKEAVAFAAESGLYPIDIWGLEWWYYLKYKKDQPEIWEYMKSVYQ